MPILDNSLLRLMTDRLSYLNQRQSVLAQNIANVDTPGYKPRDLTPFTFGDALKQADGSMKVTNAMHMTSAGVMANGNVQTQKMKSFETLPSGNAVDLEQQAMQVSQTAIDYQAVTSMYKKITSWFKLAIGRNSA